MSVKIKILGTALLTLLLTSSILYYLHSSELRRQNKSAEEQQLGQELRRIKAQLDSSASNLRSKINLLAELYNSHAFLTEHGESLREASISYDTLRDLGVSELAIIAADHLTRLFQIDDTTRTAIESPKSSDLLNLVPALTSILDRNCSGYVETKDSLRVFAAAPFPVNQGDAEPDGYIIGLAPLATENWNLGSKEPIYRIKTFGVSSWRKFADGHGLKTPQMSEATFLDTSKDFISGYASVQGPDGSSVGIIEITTKRTLTYGVERAIYLLGTSLLALTGAGLIAVLLALQMSVLHPLSGFQRDLRKINYRKLNGARVRVFGHDEISKLGTDINILLAALEQTHGELDKAKTTAELANESKSVFFSSLSHELKNTVGAIKGWLETGLRKRTGPDFRRCMANAYQATSGLVSSISGLLDYERVESGELKIVPVDFSLEKLLQEVRLTMNGLLRGSRVTFGIKVPALAPATLVGDATRLQRILTSLLSNSAKYTNHGRILLELSFNTPNSSASAQQTTVTFKVSDTGIAVDQADIPSLFDPLSATSGVSRREDKATRFGLFVCKSLVKAMGGELTASSSIGEGVCFNFSINLTHKQAAKPLELIAGDVAVVSRLAVDCPIYQALLECSKQVEVFTSLDAIPLQNKFTRICVVAQAGEGLSHAEMLNHIKEKTVLCIDSRNDYDIQEFTGRGFWAVLPGPVLTSELLAALREPQSKEAQPPIYGVPTAAKPYKILYVDDSEINRIAPGELLKEAGYDVSFASDGVELVALAESHFNGSGTQFDLIITDIFMPRMDGTIAAQQIRKLEKSLGRKERLPIVAVTGYSSDHERSQIMSYGINDVIDKPVNPQDLSNVLARFLGGSPNLL